MLEELKACITPFHFVEHASELLTKAGFTKLRDDVKWDTIPEKFFVIRDDQTIFALNKKDVSKGILFTSSSDFKCFRTKPNTISESYGLIQARVAPYGYVRNSYVDRNLAIAGRVIYKDGDQYKAKLYRSEKAVAIIPSLAVHMDRSQSFNVDYNMETNITPIFGLSGSYDASPDKQSPALMEAIGEAAGIEKESIVDFDCLFVDAQKPSTNGIDGTLISSAGCADIIQAIIALHAFIDNERESGFTALYVCGTSNMTANKRTGPCSNLIQNCFYLSGIDDAAIARSIQVNIDFTYYFSKSPDSIPAYPSIGSGAIIRSSQGRLFYSDISASAEVLNILAKHDIVPNEFDDQSFIDSPAITSKMVQKEVGIKTVSFSIPRLGASGARSSVDKRDVQSIQDILGFIVKEF